MSRRAGFTLLEVMVAIFVFAIIMGALLTMVQENLARLGRARLETEGARLAEVRLRELELEAKTDEFPELGTDEGTFDPPDDTLRWVLTVEPYGIDLPEEHQEHAGSSSVFVSTDISPDAPEPSLRRVILRIFQEDEEEELIDPFVTILVTPLGEEEFPEGVPFRDERERP